MPKRRRLACFPSCWPRPSACSGRPGRRPDRSRHPSADRQVLRGYAADTWRSFELLLDPGTGLPSDNVSASGEPSRSTSPTNVGASLWSTLAARDTGIISAAEARRRIRPPWPAWPAWNATSPAACSTTGTTRPPGPS